MAEEINRILDKLSITPNVPPYVCVTASILEGIIDELRESHYEKAFDVYMHTKNLNNLPQSFKNELEFQVRKRGYNP